MKYSVWAGPWDDEPGFEEALASHGLTGCRLAFAYHGTRLYLPRHHTRRVFDLGSGGALFDLDASRFKKLRPSRFAGLSSRPLNALDTQAWLVLCHHDALGFTHPECCITNVYGEPYPYTLCPANPDVAEYIIELCRQTATTGVSALDLEALWFFGYQHQSLHDKRGVQLDASQVAALSVCCCPHCAPASTHLRDALRATIDHAAALPDLREVEQFRRDVIIGLLRRIRAACPQVALNLRVDLRSDATGGKAAFPSASLPQLKGLVDAITLTFFGSPLADMQQTLNAFPLNDAPPIQAGFVIHEPDCRSDQDRQQRWDLFHSGLFTEISFYSWSLAATPDLAWLRRTLTVERETLCRY